jgi:hypothetical protein
MRLSVCGYVLVMMCVGMMISGLTATASAQEAKPKADDRDEDDHVVVLELGAAGDWSRTDGAHPGATIAFEVTPIEHWLELEVGFTAIRGETGTEMPVDVLFKKPWRLSPAFELMVGVGPEIIHETGPDHGTFWGVSSVVDLMFWPRKRIGWYVEPGYEVTFRHGTSHHGLGVAAGLLIAY